MNRAVRLLSCLALLLAAAGRGADTPAAAEPAPAAPAPLTLEECVRRALAKNFAVEIDQFNATNAREQVVVARANFDPVVTVSADKSGTGAPGTTLAGSAYYASRQGLDTQVGVAQNLSSGATVSASTTLTRSAAGVTPPSASDLLLNPAYTSDFALNVKQPLLRGRGRTVALAGIRGAEISRAVADLGFRGTLMDTVLKTERAYYELWLAREQLGVRRLSLAAAQQLFDENRIKRDTGVLTDLDVATAEVGVATQRREVLLAEQALRNQEDALLAVIGRFEFDLPVATLDVSVPPETPLDLNAAFVEAKAAQPEYLAATTNLDNLRLNAAVARNARLPEVDLRGALGYTNQRASADSSLGSLLGSNDYTWTVGLTLTYPWGTRGDAARYRVAANTLERETVHLRQIEQDLLVQVRSAVRAVTTSREALKVATLATALSQRQYELQKARFDAGLSTSRLVLDAQTDLDTARVDELSSKVALLESLASLRRLEGRTLDTYAAGARP